MKRRKYTRKECFENHLELLNMYYSEKKINPHKIGGLVKILQELIFSLSMQKESIEELKRLQENALEYRNEYNKVVQCQRLVEYYKLELIEQIAKLR